MRSSAAFMNDTLSLSLTLTGGWKVEGLEVQDGGWRVETSITALQVTPMRSSTAFMNKASSKYFEGQSFMKEPAGSLSLSLARALSFSLSLNPLSHTHSHTQTLRHSMFLSLY